MSKGKQSTKNRALVNFPTAAPKAALTPAATERKQYAFPRANACPRCGATDTVARSTQGQVQYRQCTRAVCRSTFKVAGHIVEFADAEK